MITQSRLLRMPISILPYLKALSPINDLCRRRIPCFAAQRVRFETGSTQPESNLMERILITYEPFYHRLCKPFSVIKSEDSIRTSVLQLQANHHVW